MDSTPNAKSHISLGKHDFIKFCTTQMMCLIRNGLGTAQEDKDKPSVPGIDLTLLCKDEDLL